MSSEALLERLLKAHEAYYDVHRGYRLGGVPFPAMAEFRSDASQYVLIKRAKLWEAHTHEYLFFYPTTHLDEELLAGLITLMTEAGVELVDPEPNHMTSYLSLVIIADTADPSAVRQLRKTRFRKNLRLGLDGWIDLRLAVVDLATRTVTTNGQGKPLKATLEANLAQTPTG